MTLVVLLLASLQGWNPLERQESEADTLFLLDADAEQKLTPGDGGLIPGNAAGGDAPWTKVVAVDGKFRRGLHSTERTYGLVWMPSIGLLAPDEFTIELWLRSDVPWVEAIDQTPLAIVDQNQSCELRLRIHGPRLELHWGHQQDPSGPVKAMLLVDLKKNPVAADEWVNVAFTLKDRTLRLYVNGKAAAEKSGLPPPRVWSDAARGDGLSLAGAQARGATNFSLSDLRISRKARTPGAKIEPPKENVLSVHPDRPESGAIRQTLLGSLHYFKGPETEKMAEGLIRVMRTDKMLTSTPMKAGAPDAEHPSAGASGKFAYDWQVVDRTFDYYKRLGMIPYISVDSTPSILGGKTLPFSGEKLTTKKTGNSGFTPEIPNDFDAFGAIVHDLVHHAVVEKGYEVPYWGIWNEPDGPSFWNNKLDDYLRLYEVCVGAIKSVRPTLKVGGPETAHFDREWTEGLIKLCAAKKLPLDFVSWHYYLTAVSGIAQVRAVVDHLSRTYGLGPTPELIVGEWCWQIHNFPKSGYRPWKERNYFINDWHAAFTAASLIEMQNDGVVVSIYTKPTSEAGTGGFDATGLMSEKHPWANLNVFRLWSRMAPTPLAAEYDGRPGVSWLASRDASGKLTVLLSHLRYRKDVSVELALKIPGLTSESRVTEFVIDDQHSNAFDAGLDHSELETVAPPAVADGELKVTLRPRSVHLLEISAPKKER